MTLPISTNSNTDFITSECSAGKPGEVLPVNIAARKAINAATLVLNSESVPLNEASGRVTSRKITATFDLPPFSNSAMDGYAVNTADFDGDAPWQFDLVGRIAAGDNPLPRNKLKTTMQIFTGAPVPAGFDSVVMQEHCERRNKKIMFHSRPKQHLNIRKKGEDVPLGSHVIDAGCIMTSARQALVAALGQDKVDIFKKLRIGLISTGNELCEPGSDIGDGQIYNSNRYFLLSALRQPWVDIIDFGIVEDNAEVIRNKIRQATSQCDVLITTGGVSAGGEDHMFEVLRRENAELEVLKVAMRPGKPVTVGKIGQTLLFALPGNPYAMAVTFSQIALPVLRKLAGMTNYQNVSSAAIADFSHRKRLGRTEFVPVHIKGQDGLGRPIATLLGRGAAASLNPMCMANAIAELPAQLEYIENGALLTTYTLSQLQWG